MDPDETAEELLFVSGMWGLPVDVRGLARRLGLRVIERGWPGLPQAVSLPGLRLVILNRKRPECARRFDLAHELWHFLCKETPLLSPRERRERHGRNANRFACALLMPRAAFEAAWRGTIAGKIRKNGELDAVCARFAVSWTAALLRGKSMRLVT